MYPPPYSNLLRWYQLVESSQLLQLTLCHPFLQKLCFLEIDSSAVKICFGETPDIKGVREEEIKKRKFTK